MKPPTRKPYLTFQRQKPPEGSQPQRVACSHVLTLLGGARLSPHEAPQLGKSGKGLLFSRDAPPPQRVSDVVSCGWFPAAWGPSLSPFRGSFSLEGRSFAPSRTGPITHLPPCGMAPSQDRSPSVPRGIEAGLRLTHRPSPSKGWPCREPAPSPEANNQVALLGWGTGQGAAGLAGTPAFHPQACPSKRVGHMLCLWRNGVGGAERGPSPHPWGLDIPVAPGERHPILGSLSQTSQGWRGTDLSPSRTELKSRPQPLGHPAADKEAERGPCSSQSHTRVTMVLPLLQLRAAGQCQGLVTMEVTGDGGLWHGVCTTDRMQRHRMEWV